MIREAADCVLLHAAGGFVRVFLTDGSLENSFAISLSLFLIVTSSVLIGTMLPFGLAKAGVDPANAGTSVQVRCTCLCGQNGCHCSTLLHYAHKCACMSVSQGSWYAGSHGHFRCCNHLLHLQPDVESSESSAVTRMNGLYHCFHLSDQMTPIYTRASFQRQHIGVLFAASSQCEINMWHC